jgi:adenine-specific DNA-methyltransferase
VIEKKVGKHLQILLLDFENRHSAKELSALGLEFDFSKPSKLVEYLISISKSNKNAIILDSFAGSAEQLGKCCFKS